MKNFFQKLMCLGTIFSTGCAIATYPGQPGIVTNGYSKIDLEVLMEDGLWVYETTYDNRPEGKGVSAIVTKLYPGARTYTTNVRTNEFGTLYRSKSPYQGAQVQMISMPQANQYVVSPDSHVMLMAEYDAPLDEIDDRNLAEEKIFAEFEAPKADAKSGLMYDIMAFRHKLLKVGKFSPYGNVSYDISALEFSGKIFTPSKSIRVESNLLQNGVRTNLDVKTRSDFVRFLEYHFPQGFRGEVILHVNDEKIPFKAPLTLKTLQMAKNSGATWKTL